MNRVEALDLLTTTTSVTVRQAAAALGVSDRIAYRNAATGHLVPGVPVIHVTRRRWLVPSAAVLRVLQLQDFTAASSPPATAAPLAVENGGGGPA